MKVILDCFEKTHPTISTNQILNWKQSQFGQLCFPGLQVGCLFLLEFSLVNNVVNLCSDWQLWLPWFWFFDPQLWTALMVFKIQQLMCDQTWFVIFLQGQALCSVPRFERRRIWLIKSPFSRVCQEVSQGIQWRRNIRSTSHSETVKSRDVTWYE